LLFEQSRRKELRMQPFGCGAFVKRAVVHAMSGSPRVVPGYTIPPWSSPQTSRIRAVDLQRSAHRIRVRSRRRHENIDQALRDYHRSRRVDEGRF
jgi:hypothetical protein